MKYSVLTFFILLLIGAGCTSGKAPAVPSETTDVSGATEVPTDANVSDSMAEATDTEKLCGWIDESDIVIKLNFAEGVEKDASYEVGFYFSPIYLMARLAREGCDYRTGFNFDELEGKGVAEVGVRGYSDNVRRTLANEPIPIIFDAEGKPDIGTLIEVTVTN